MQAVARISLAACSAGILSSVPVPATAAAVQSGAEVQTDAKAPAAVETKTEIDAETDNSLVQDVIVTARRRAEDIQSVPVSIVAIGGDQLKAQGITVSTDLQYSVPGLTATGVAGTRESPPISLRAQGQTFGGALPSVQSYFDEIPTPGSMSTLYDMESVQVLKGPQGTLFGRNTTGGAILYQSKRPEPDFGGYIAVRAGNIGYREIEGALNLPLGDKAALRIAGDILRRDGYTRDLTTGADLDDQHRDDVRVSLSLKPSDDVSSDFVATGFKVRQNGGSEILYSVPAGGLLSTPFFDGLWGVPGYLAQQQANGNRATWSVIGHPNYFNRDFWLVSNITAVQFGGVEFKNIIAYQETRTASLANLAGVPTPVLYQGGGSLLNPGPEKGGSGQFSEEAHLSGLAFDGKLNWIAGASFIRERPVGKYVQTVVVLGNPFSTLQTPTLTTQDTITEDYGVFAQGTYDASALVEGLKLTAGLRYSINKQSLDSVAGQERSTAGVPNGTFVCQVPGLAPTTPLSGCHVNLSAEFKAPSWTVSADWQVTPSTLIYVATRRGFRAGGFNPTAIDPSVFQYGSEKLTDIELGIKGHWRLTDFLRLRGSLAAYHSHVQDVQRFAAISVMVNGQPTIITVTRNAGTAKVNGVEFQGTALFGKNVELVANYAYTDASILAQPGIIAGTSFGGVPKTVYSLMGVVRAPLDPKLGEVKLSATWYHQSKTPFVDNLDVETQAFGPAYSLVNLRIDWRGLAGSNLDLGAFVNNATNKQYLVDGLIALDSSFGYSVHAFGAPRTFGAEVKYHF